LAESEDEKEFEVVDKRKVKAGKDGEAHTEPEAEASEAQPEAETKAGEEEQVKEEPTGLPPVDVNSLLKSFVGLLGAHAWQWLGLVKNPLTGKVGKDLEQAKVAIDSISILIDQLDGKIDPAEQRELKCLLSDLQINFVQQSAKEPS